MQVKNKNVGRVKFRAGILGMAAASALMGRSVHAGTDIWTSTATGTSGTTSANQLWNNANNWSPLAIPGSTDVTQFNTSAIPHSNTAEFDFTDGAISTGAITDTITATNGSASALTLTGVTAGTITLNAASVTATVPSGTQVLGSTSETFPNVIIANTDNSILNKTLTFGANTNIALGNSNGSNTILDYAGTGNSSKNNSGFPVITINGNISNATSTAENITFAGGGSPTVEGGELLLTGTNTFTGGITIGNAGTGSGSQVNLQSGEVYATTPAALPTTGTITVNEQSQLGFSGSTTAITNYSTGGQTLILNGIGMGKNISGALRPTGGSQNTPLQWLGNIQLGTSASYDADNGAVLVTVASGGSWFRLVGNMTGGNFIEQGGGVFALAGTNNTYGSTQLGNGGIWVEPQSSLGTGDLQLAQTSTNNPTITLNNATQTIAGLSSAFTQVASTNGNGYEQNISLNGTQLVVTEPTANTTFGYGSVYLETSGINDFNGGNFSGNTGTGTVVGGGSLVYNCSTGHVLTLTGQNSYSGGTTIRAGTLDIANNVPGVSVGSVFGTGPVNVLSGGTLASGNYAVPFNFSGGSSAAASVTGGTFTGPLNVSSGGIVSPGGGNIGFLNTGAINASAGSIFDFSIGSATAGNYSTITSSGAANFNTSGTETVNITGSAFAVGTYDLITGTSISSNASGGGLVLGTTPNGRNRIYALSETATQLVLTVTNTGTEIHWSIGGSSPAVDGGGTWSEGSTNFYNSSGTTVTPQYAYNSSTGFDTVFGTSSSGNGGTITLGSNVKVGGLFVLGQLATGQSYTFTPQAATANSLTLTGGIAASNNTSIGAPVVLAASQAWSADSNVVLTVSGNISESTSSQLSKTGNGTVVLTGTGSWSGGTNISQGTLQTTTSGIPTTGGVINNSVLDFDQTTAGSYSGLISGSGSVVVSNAAGTGSPSIALTNATNTYTGSTTITGGTLQVASVGNLGTGDGGVVLSGGTLQATGNLLFPLNPGGGSTQKRTLTLTGATTSTIDTQGYTVEFDSNIRGTGNLDKIGTGTLVLEGIPSTTAIGALISSQGTIQIAQQLAGASFIFSGTNPAAGASQLESGKIEVTGPTLVRLNGGDFGGGGTFQIDPSGIQVIGYGLSNTTVENNFVINPTNVPGYLFQIGADTGSTLALNGAIVDTSSSTVDFTGGKGTVFLGGTSSYLGSTTVDQNIQLTTNNSLPAATDVSFTGSGNFDLNGFNQSVGSIASSSSNSVIQNSGSNGNSVLTVNGPSSTTFNGVLEDATGLPTLGLTVNASTGSLALPNPELYSGPVTVLSGRLDITGISNGSGTATVNSTGLGAASNISIGSLSAPTALTAQLRFSGIAGPNDTNGKPTNVVVSFVTQNHPQFGSPFYPTITLNALGGYNNGAGTVDQGAIRASGGSYLTLEDPIVFASSSVIAATSSSILTLDGTLSGGGSLISQGNGLLILSGTNTGYTGGTEIDAGTVTVAASSSLGTGPLAVNNDTSNGSNGSPVVLNLNNAAQSVGSLSGIINPAFNGSNTATINLAPTTVLTINQTVPGVYAGAINSSGGSIVKTGSAALTLAGGVNYVGTTNVSAGTLTFGPNIAAGIQNISSAGLTVASGASLKLGISALTQSRTLLTTASLSLAGGTGAWTGRLDIGNNDAVVQAAGSAGLATISNQIKQGYSNGTFTGNGITSSAAAADTTHLTAVGVILNSDSSGSALYGSGTAKGTFDGSSPSASDVLIKYTYYGDTNLDGHVDASDYSRIDNGFLQHLTGWYNGDFNYDGVINGSDYTLIDNAFNTQGAALADAIATPTSQIAPFDGAGAGAAVPEPASLGLIGLLAVTQLSRRKRRSMGVN
jgi:autotransporter-associated beta strand protein